MTRLLIRLFVRDGRNVEDPEVRKRLGSFAGIVGIITNFLLFAAKMAAGLLFHSIAVTADAVNNLSDFGSSVVALAGFRLAAKPADKEHPYGHERIEYISGVIVSIAVVIVGFQLAKESVIKIIHPENTEFSLISVAVLAGSIAVKIWQSRFYKTVGGIIRSSMLSATSVDSLNDVISTGVVLAGTFVTKFTGFNLDGYLGLAVASLIMVTGVRLVIETSDPLLGSAPSTEFVDEIYRSILSYDGILGIHDLNVHNYGPGRCFASVHCEVPAERDILESHDIIDNIERDFLKNKGIHLVIHMDPIVTNDERTDRMRECVGGILAGMSPEISMHDFRAVWGPTHANLVFDVCVPFGFFMTDQELTDRIEAEVSKLEGNCFAVVTVDHDYVPTVPETKN